MVMFPLLLVICLCGIIQWSHAGGVNCDLNSTNLSCAFVEAIQAPPADMPSGTGLSMSISVIGGDNCDKVNLKSVHYSSSVPSHFDYCNVKPVPDYKGCNQEFDFSAVNTTFFSTSFLPTNAVAQDVTNKLTIAEIEPGCTVQVAMNYLWIHNVSPQCSL